MADQDGAIDAGLIEHEFQVLLLKEAVGASIAFRPAVAPAVIRDDVETASQEPIDDADAAVAIVGNAVKIDDRRLVRHGIRSADPARKANAHAIERTLDAVFRSRAQ